MAAHLDRGRHLLLADLFVLLLFCGGFEALPRQRSPEEVHDNIAQRLDVVTPALLDAQMCVDGRISSSARQVLVLSAITTVYLFLYNDRHMISAGQAGTAPARSISGKCAHATKI